MTTTPDAPVLSGALRIRDLRRNPAFAPGGERFGEFVRHFLSMVHGAAAALIPENPEAAEAVTWAVFQTFAIKYKTFPGRRLVAPWLLRSVRFAAARERSRLRLKAKPATFNGQAAQRLIRFLIKTSQRKSLAIIQSCFFNEPAKAFDFRKLDKELKKLAAKLSQPGASAAEVLRAMPRPPAPEAEERLLAQATQWTRKTPKTYLTRSTLASWRWVRIGTIFRRIAATVGLIVALLATTAGTTALLVKHGKVSMMKLFVGFMTRDLLAEFPDLAKPAQPFSPPPQRAPKNSAALYTPTNIWAAKLSFTPEQWKAIQPVTIPPAENVGGKMSLRNPKASRSGLAGAVGLDFHWSQAKFQFADAEFDAVGARFRGNGTYLNSLWGLKSSFKVDVNHVTKGQKIGGVTKLNFINSIPDFTYIKDSLAERLFRDLGSISPRTTYAYLTIDVPGLYPERPLGLYVMAEDIDDDFAKDRFGTKAVPIFKPVTYDLFADWGKDWSAYKDIYDLKTKATPEQLQRVVDFAQLVAHASDEEFAKRLEEFLDLEDYAAFLGGHVLMSSYDGYLANGQNFYMYLDPRTDKFGFIPWDQDHGWGEFSYVGTPDTRENASIWHPAAYDNHFLKRVIKVEAFRKVYRRKLEQALAGPFSETNLFPQIDALAAAIRPAVAAESDLRLKRFNLETKTRWLRGVRETGHMNDGNAEGPRSHPHQIKRFISVRIQSVREQLEGETDGARLTGFGEQPEPLQEQPRPSPQKPAASGTNQISLQPR